MIRKFKNFESHGYRGGWSVDEESQKSRFEDLINILQPLEDDGIVFKIKHLDENKDNDVSVGFEIEMQLDSKGFGYVGVNSIKMDIGVRNNTLEENLEAIHSTAKFSSALSNNIDEINDRLDEKAKDDGIKISAFSISYAHRRINIIGTIQGNILNKNKS